MRILRRAALAVAMVLAPAAHAGSCGYDYCWGAVGFGPNGAWGYSYGQFSEDEAVNVAQDGCGWNCTVVKTFYNTCGAIAVADNGGWGWGAEPVGRRKHRHRLLRRKRPQLPGPRLGLFDVIDSTRKRPRAGAN